MKTAAAIIIALAALGNGSLYGISKTVAAKTSTPITAGK